MMRHRLGAMVLLWVLLRGVSAAMIHVDAPYSSEVYVRKSGESKYTFAAGSTPALVRDDGADSFDIRLVARVSFFRIATGEYPNVRPGDSISVPMAEETDTARLGIIAFICIGISAWAVGRHVKRPQQQLSSVGTPSGRSVTAAGAAYALSPDDMVDSYRVVARLARGGMGAVYEVEDTYGDRYAMKVPDPHFMESTEMRARFEREISIGRNLHHPHIVRLYDCNGQGDTPYLVMELVRGPSLAQVLKQEKPLEPSRAVYIATCLLDALEYGHQRGVIHRDVKPANVLMAPGGVPKLSDYGIARLGDAGNLTATSSAIGTPHYMAPEQVHAKEVDVRSDVYAMGVILFDCLTGRLPFEEPDAMAVVMQKLAVDPPVPSSINPRLPPVFDAILMRALARRPEYRYPSAQAFLDDLAGL
ncbi:MAG TPA: serine/threonine-protein kinase [Candidatus Xenobia bacterium]|jgi:serine/threonine protein kinase